MSDAQVGQPIAKISYIDLMKIKDPPWKARKPLNDDVMTFPFFMIPNIDVVAALHTTVCNDNNLPFSSSRDPNKADDNELAVLEGEVLLNAK